MISAENFFDYLFSDTQNLKKEFLLGTKESISFVHLYEKSLAVAGYIQEHAGIGKNIPIISHNNLFFMIAYLGIIKSGNVAVPLNPAIESGNLSYILETCECSGAFVSKDIIGRLNLPFSTWDEEMMFQMAERKIRILYPEIQEEDPAEIIFTSGSTGVPKGVMLSHRNLEANTNSIIHYLKLSTEDRMLVVLPFYYCYGLSLLHTHLRIGASIVFNNSFIFLGGILRDLNQYNCTGFAGVPSHYQILLRKSKSFVTTAFPQLRYVTQAGGKLSSPFIREFIQAFPKINFFVMYGQTEATARLTYLPPEMLEQKMGSVGISIPGVIIRIVGENGYPVQTGESGEIIAHGDNIMKGYYKDEALTAATIRNGWLHTGDIGSQDADGYIFIDARKKEIIKVGGKRVSPKEIEEVILQLPAVLDCTISAEEDPLLGEAICATIVLTDEGKLQIDEKDILNHCHNLLAAFKVPSIIRFESSLKVSATGKKTLN